jgi:outer membrane lipoprotein SlyB
MEIAKTPNRIHPLMAGAAVSVMLVSLVGAAAITGILPNSHSTTAPVSAAVGTPSSTDATLAANSAGNSSTSSAKENAAPSRAPSPHAAPVRHSQPRTTYAATAQASSVCVSCGRIESVQTIQQPAKPSGLGIAAGALLGGVLGHQVGGGNGRTLATVAGAVGGGYAGNEVEKRSRATTSYQVRVRMDDGSMRTFPYAEQPGWNTGDRVRVVNGTLAARG